MDLWTTRKKDFAAIELDDRSTKRQLGKLHSILAEQRRRKESISVILYLDIKNAFNAINHRAIFYVLEAKGFPSEDIALFKRMYTHQ